MVQALLVEDDLQSLEALAKLIAEQGFDVATAATIKEARHMLETASPAVVVSDLMLPDGKGLDLVKDINRESTDIVLMTGHASVDTAIEALRLGVSDYLTKPVDLHHLKSVLAHIRQTRELREEIGSLREELVKLGRFGQFLGASSPIQKVYELILRVAPTEATVLLTGESGTGKDLAAQTIHQFSK